MARSFGARVVLQFAADQLAAHTHQIFGFKAYNSQCQNIPVVVCTRATVEISSVQYIV